jgi:hypothetical protein
MVIVMDIMVAMGIVVVMDAIMVAGAMAAGTMALDAIL